ncbi:MAG TPA: type VI secretion system tube protein Hcp [Bryobacteraceae bacterium]|nr:type VI secretion system tube protein Hcp [Bryobacteraceae bacterium]
MAESGASTQVSGSKPSNVDFFLKVDGIDGESKDLRHPKELQLLDFSIGISNRGKQSDYGGVSKAVFHNPRFVMYTDFSFPKLKQACATGERIPKMYLVCRKAGNVQHEYLRVRFENVYITSCEIAGGRHPQYPLAPVVEFSISFQIQQIEYREQKQDGSLAGSMMMTYDLAQLKKNI